MRSFPRARRSAGPALRRTALSVSAALMLTLVPSPGRALSQQPPGTGTVRDVRLSMDQGSISGPARLSAGQLVVEATTTGQASPGPHPGSADSVGPDSVGPDSVGADPADATPGSLVAVWQSSPLDVGGARMLGFSWSGQPDTPGQRSGPAVQVRTDRGDGWSAWQALEADDAAPDPGSPDDRHPDRVFTQGLWLAEGTRSAQVEVALPVPAQGGVPVRFGDLRAHLITPDLTPTPSGTPVSGAPASGAAAPRVAARADAPAIISRASWGANERLVRERPRYVRHLQVGFLHHTVQSNDYSPDESAALIRSNYLYHVQSRGFADIGYNFLVDRFGNIFEGRAGGVGQAVIGAHTGGFNHASFGVALVGNFDTMRVPSAAHRALARLFAWKLDLHHVDPQGASMVRSTGGGSARWPAGEVVRMNAISGHSDAGYTACPGRHGYAFLATLRVSVARTGLPKVYGGRVSRTSIRPGSGQQVVTGVRFSAHVNWSAAVTAANGQQVRRWSGQGTWRRLVWDGSDGDGRPAPRGTATLRIYANWRGLHARPVVANIRVT